MTKSEITSIPSDIKPLVRRLLKYVNSLQFDLATQKALEIHFLLGKSTQSDNELELNKQYVFTLYSEFLKFYVELWEQISLAEMHKSWQLLQDSLDALRGLKRFSTINISFFERQLTEIEKAYPYAVFASTAIYVDYFECSICGLNIDSNECSHRRYYLYSGQLAYGIARGTCEAEHIALVGNPRDKRCVVLPQNGEGELKDFTKELSIRLKKKELSILDFDCVQIFSKKLNNEEYKHAHLTFTTRRLAQISI